MTLQEGEAEVEASNVVRFPVERRMTLDILRQIAPDARQVLLLAGTFEIALPVDPEARADQAAAEFILNQVPSSDPERADRLRGMLADVLSIAFRAVRDAELMANTAGIAREELAATAAVEVGYTLQELERHAADLSLEAAEALVVAHERTLEAFGVARAVDLAFRGEPWTPRQVNAEMDALIIAEVARRAH